MGCKVMLTDSAVSFLEKEELADLYIDNMPVGFTGLLRSQNLTVKNLEVTWNMLIMLYKIKDVLEFEREELSELISALTEDEYKLYYMCERLLLKKVNNDSKRLKKKPKSSWQEIVLSKQVSALIQLIIERGEKMEQLRMLAKIAWEGRLKGQSLKKNSLMMPFDLVFDKSAKSDFIDTGNSSVLL